MGYGTSASPETAYRRFLAAAKFGLPSAANMLAMLYEKGLGVPQDLVQAHHWYKRAAAHDDPEGLYNLGRVYEEGIGVVADADTAATFYLRAAEANQLDAQASLGYLYESGALRDGVDYAEALYWYKFASGLGNPKAANNYGAMFYFGREVEQDFEEAVVWFK